MFDMKKAFDAAFAVAGSVNEKAHAIRFVLRYSMKGVPVTQWRSAGNESNVIRALITELGFTDADVINHVSSLDESVTDFRWTPTGLKKLDSILNYMSLVPGAFQTVSSMLRDLYSSSAPEPVEFPEPTEESGNAADEFKFRIEEKTRERVAEYLEKFPTGELSEFLRGSVSAVPSLGVIERILVDLGLSDPNKAMFDGPLTGFDDHKTIIRHITPRTSMPTAESASRTALPLEYALAENLGGAAADPLHGFFYRTADESAELSGYGDDALVVSFEEFSASRHGTALVRSSDLPEFWNYVAGLYRTFFETGAEVLPSSRIVIVCDDETWVSRTESVNSGNKRIVGLFRQSGFIRPGTKAGVSVHVTIGPKSPRTATLTRDNVTEFRKYAVPADVNISSYDKDWIPTRLLPAEWFCMIHPGGSRVLPRNNSTFVPIMMRMPSSRRRTEALLAKLDAASRPTPGTVARMTSCTDSDNTLAGTLIKGICGAVRLHAKFGDSGVELSPWTGSENADHAYDAVHDRTALMSAVYSGIPYEGSFFSRVFSDEALNDGTAVGEYFSAAPGHQMDCDPGKPDPMSRVIVFETNAVAEGTEALYNAVVRCVNTMLVTAHTTPEVAADPTGTEFAASMPEGYPESVRFPFPVSRVRESLETRGLVTGRLPFLSTGHIPDSHMDVSTGDGVSVRFLRDDRGRLHIAVLLSSWKLTMALLTFRYSTGLPPVSSDMAMAADSRSNVLSGSEEEIVRKFIRCVISDDCATDFGGLEASRRKFGIGPIVKTHRTDPGGGDTFMRRTNYEAAVPYGSTYCVVPARYR